MFSHATPLDVLMMAVAAIVAVLHGAVLPSAMFAFGRLTNAFVNQYSSAQLANFELTFDPDFYLAMGRLAEVDFRVISTGFINFTNITGGVVNCSDSYELLPFNQTFDDILKLGVTQLASCLDNPTFLAVSEASAGTAESSVLSLLRQELGWFDAASPGEIASRLTQDVDRVQDGLGEKLGLLLQWTATLVAGVVVSLITEWRLALLMAFAGLLIALSTALLSIVTTLSTSHTLSLSASASAIAEEALAAIATVKAFCAESEETERYSTALRQVRRRGQFVGVVSGLSLGVVQLLVFSCYAGSLWLGGYLVQEEIIQAGQFVTVFFAVLLVGVSIGQVLPHVQQLLSAHRAASTLEAIVTREPLINPRPEKGMWPAEGLEPAIEFVNVCFSYPSRPETEVLKNVSFMIPAGHTVAVVGATGSGKSTIGHLLTRLYDISSGQVMVGRYDVSTLLTNRLRDVVGVVSQDPALFHTTIAENIRHGGTGGVVITQSDIETAARQANAHDFICQLPQGYKTVVGSRGNQLSGGQKQRIAIARALVRNPKLLLLDEATSALDTESERIVQEALDKSREGRTTIIIAHRLSTVQHADNILVMEGGVVMEMGSHDQLLKKEGVYYNLVNAQLPTVEEERENHVSNATAVTDPGSPSLSPTTADGRSDMEDAGSVSLFRVLRLSLAEWPVLVAGVIAAGVQGAIFPSFSIFFGRALQAFTFPFHEVLDRTHKWAWLFIGLGFVSAVATVMKIMTFSVAGEQLKYRLRCQALDRILRHPMSWFSTPSSSGVAGLLASDPPAVQGGIQFLSSLSEVAIGLIAALIIAMVASWPLALVVVGFIPLLVGAGLVQVWLLGRRRGGTLSSSSSKVLLEGVIHIKTVQLFGLHDVFIVTYGSTLVVPLRTRVADTLGLGCVYGFTNFILLIAYSVTFRFAAYLITLPVDHTFYVEFNEVFTVFLAIILGSLTAGQASAALPLVTRARAAAGRLLAVTAEQSGDERGEEKTLETVKGALALTGVTFSFPSRPKVRVLSQLSVAVGPGQCLALVGPSGAGKSTVLSLLERFHSPQLGYVALDGTDIAALGLRWWRGQLGWVPQDILLFNRTIAENIAYGCHDSIDHTQIEKAAITANIHSFITSLPEGYKTVVGSRGNQLSGGQKQRIAIARALVRNPKLLLLDEATSALDTESERIVQEALDKAREGRTTIIIAHRLSTVAKADHIAVLQAGHVVEEGTCEQLLQQKRLYWQLAQQK